MSDETLPPRPPTVVLLMKMVVALRASLAAVTKERDEARAIAPQVDTEKLAGEIGYIRGLVDARDVVILMHVVPADSNEWKTIAEDRDMRADRINKLIEEAKVKP